MTRGRLVRVWGAAALAGVVALSAGLRFVAATGVPVPWIAPDEMLYALLGRGLWSSGHLSVLGGNTPYYSAVYPALAGLPLSLGDVHAGYTALKALQAVTMSLAAVPVYLWGRTLMRRGWALAAATLTLAIPGLAYSGLVMTEVAFYPVFVLAAWAAAAAIARPARRRQALLAGAVALAVATRLQALVLVPALLTAIALEAVLARELRRSRALWPVAAVALAALVALAAGGASALGGYAAAGHASYGAADALRYVLYHAAAALLVCGVVPACAVALLTIGALRRPEPSAAVRAYLAVAVSFTLWLVLEVGVFASRHAFRIEERDLLGLAPLLFLGFALWLDRGAPRTYAAAAAVGLAAAAIALAVPYGTFVDDAAVPDSFTFAAALGLLRSHPSLDPALLFGVPAAVAAALPALLPRRALPATAALLLAALVAASVAASSQVRAESRDRQAALVGAEPRWVDRAVTGSVAYVYGGSRYWNAVWESLFWNRRIRAVYDLPRDRVGGDLPQTVLPLRGDGVLRAGGRPIPYRYVVAATNLTFAGSRLAEQPLAGFDQAGLALWRLSGTPRLLDEISGLQPNGDLLARAELVGYGCTSGSFVLTLLGKTDARVDFFAGGALVRRVTTTPGNSLQVVVQARPRRSAGGSACRLLMTTTSLVGVTRLELARG